MSKDLVWNIQQAEQVRRESELAMREQAENMSNTATVYRGFIPGLTQRAEAEEHTSRTAMKTIWHTDSEGNSWSEQVTDWVARQAAANRAASLREQCCNISTRLIFPHSPSSIC